MTIETPMRIEPAGIEEMIPEPLTDLVVTIRSNAAEVGRGLHPDSLRELRAMTRIMNSYYSNLIEGHNTRPRDIEAALAGRADEVENRPLALEAAAHVHVQQWIDDLADADALPEPTSVAFLAEVHRRFYDAMPPEFRFVERDGVRHEVVPGAFRAEGQEVTVGRHVPPSAHRLADFMAHYESRYRGLTRGATGAILSIPAAHHRLNYIHPFLDGNGRVSRLMSHAMCRRAGLGGQGLWSISRGLARGLTERGEYMTNMDAADRPRQGDRDGRGNLSMAALQGFTGWFLRVMLDQIDFTRSLLDQSGLRDRYLALVRDVTAGDDRVMRLVDHVLRYGEMPRGDAALVLRVGDRTGRDTLKAATTAGFLTSTTPKAPVRIAFPLQWRERLFPNLFADAPLDPVAKAGATSA
jgi:Fic family protein